MKTLIFFWPLEACDTEISISGGSSGDSLHNRTEFSFYVSEKIYVVQDLISVSNILNKAETTFSVSIDGACQNEQI